MREEVGLICENWSSCTKNLGCLVATEGKILHNPSPTKLASLN